MTKNTATSTSALLANEVGYDPIEDRLRLNIRSTIEAVFEEELDQFLGRCRYSRRCEAKTGYRHGHRERHLTGTFGPETVNIPRARVKGEDGKTKEWHGLQANHCRATNGCVFRSIRSVIPTTSGQLFRGIRSPLTRRC